MEKNKKTYTLVQRSCLGPRACGYNLYRSISSEVYSLLPQEVDSIPEQVTAESNLFDLVYSSDPITRLPVGDIAMHLGAEVSPDVKRFIELQIHAPQQISGDNSGDFSGIDDDDIAELTRSNDESLSSYSERVKKFIQSLNEDN